MARNAEFNFIEERLIPNKYTFKKEGRADVYIDTKSRNLKFSKRYIKENDLGGKTLKFYYDREKKAIGWRIMDGYLQISGFRDYKKVHVQRLGTANIGVKRLCDAIGVKPGEKFKDLKVQKRLVDGKTMYFVQLNRPIKKHDSGPTRD